jgi:hypothetical protein
LGAFGDKITPTPPPKAVTKDPPGFANVLSPPLVAAVPEGPRFPPEPTVTVYEPGVKTLFGTDDK